MQTDYLHGAKVWVIFATVLVVTLPLSVLRLSGALPKAALDAYICVFALTHFLITFTLYLQSRNLEYFKQGPRNWTVYFTVPLLIWVGFDLFSALEGKERLPLIGAVIPYGVLLFDFSHFTRQNFGVQQLFQAKLRGKLPSWIRPVQNAYWLLAMVVLFETGIGDGAFKRHEPRVLGEVAVLLCLALAIAFALVKGFRGAGSPEEKKAARNASLYFGAQTLSFGFAAYDVRLYMLALATHYVEYHVLMAPRCFDAPLDQQSRLDRFFGALRANRVVFYGTLLALAATALFLPMLKDQYAAGSGVPLRVLLNLYNGLFVFHYFVESFVWKFNQPFYRETLGPLYFRSR